MDSIPDQGDEAANRILREIIEEDERQAKAPPLRRARAHGVGLSIPRGIGCIPCGIGRLAVPGPPCLPLATDFAAVLLDESRWPDHVCQDVARALNQSWMRSQFSNDISNAVVVALSAPTVIPVGRRSLEKSVASLPGSRPNTKIAGHGMPFNGDEHAMIVVTARLPHATVTMFGLAKEQDLHKAGKASFRVDGVRPDHESVRTLISTARCFWGRFAGKSVEEMRKGGRPRASGKLLVDPRRNRALLRKWRAERDAKWEPLPYTVQGFADYAGVSPDTVSRRIREGKLPWSPPK